MLIVGIVNGEVHRYLLLIDVISLLIEISIW